ncbi:putative D-lactate dehydrogenase, mitochondrial isoform X2 [Oratosquilla oratoria]|uniref:putative D-lactate dehydrogenase, mitochondrial isoform X2 n=1 Tax=Oratosquilla oratoria TaxID=337810 RepID=UPI003F76E965
MPGFLQRCSCLRGVACRYSTITRARPCRLDEASVNSLERVLCGVVNSKGGVSRGRDALRLAATDEGPHIPISPDIVVKPETVQQVQEVVRACYLQKAPIIPRGTGTGLEGGVSAPFGGVCVDLTLLDGLETHIEDQTATVQPGVTRLQLNADLRGTGLWFPVDPGADASLCGMVATGASGTNTVRYGTMLANTRNLQVVMADGSLVHTAGPGVRTRKSSAGYNLTSLMVGSEGTLGLITEATLQLHGLPETQLSAVCSFPTVRAAVDTTIAALQCSLPVARIEFLDEVALDACNQYSGLSYNVLPTLFFEFHGSEAEVKAQAKFLAEISKEFRGGDFLWAVETEARSQLWKARHDLFYASLALHPGCRCVVTDVAVPISRLPDLVEQAQVLIQDANLVGPMLGHVGDGNFHTLLLFDPKESSQFQAAKGVADSLARNIKN